MGVNTSDKHNEHVPEKVFNKYFAIITDQTIPANRPDIIVHNKEKNYLLIDTVIHDVSSISSKEHEKVS